MMPSPTYNKRSPHPRSGQGTLDGPRTTGFPTRALRQGRMPSRGHPAAGAASVDVLAHRRTQPSQASRGQGQLPQGSRLRLLLDTGRTMADESTTRDPVERLARERGEAISQESVEIVKRLLDAINRRDLNVVDEFATPDVEFVPALEGSVEGQAYRGREGWESYLAEIEDTWEVLRIFGAEFRDLDDRVLVLGRAEGRGKGSGVPVGTPFAMVLELRDGKILRSHSFLDHGEALRAAGLTE